MAAQCVNFKDELMGSVFLVVVSSGGFSLFGFHFPRREKVILPVSSCGMVVINGRKVPFSKLKAQDPRAFFSQNPSESC